MYILIAGEDEIAFRLAEALMTDHEVAMLCPNRDVAFRTERMDAEVTFGPITSTSTLRALDVERADVFVAASKGDENNLVACVAARQLGAARTVCFLLRPEFHGSEEDRRLIGESLGIDDLVVPAEQLAEEIVRIVLIPGALDVEVFVGGRVRLLQQLIGEGARITQGTLRDVGVPEGVVLVMARRGETMFIPKGTSRFQVGDKITAMGSTQGINRLVSRYLRGSDTADSPRKATIVGGGTVGLAVAQALEGAHWDLKLIESDEDRCETIAPLVKGLVLHGDGTDLDLLESERVGQHPVLVAVTSNDEKNLLISLLAKELGVQRILTRVDVQSNERLFDRVGVDVVLSARGAALKSVLQSVGHSSADLLAELDHGDAEVIEIQVPPDQPERPLASMKSDLFAIIGAILRGGRVIIPRGTDAVLGGDRLLVFCTSETEAEVRAFFSGRNG